MMKNIKFSAPEELIEKARKQEEARGTTLNNEFREWLKHQAVSNGERAYRYRKLIERLGHVNAGRKFSRDEMNEH
jgi:hypothetical protein